MVVSMFRDTCFQSSVHKALFFLEVEGSKLQKNCQMLLYIFPFARCFRSRPEIDKKSQSPQLLFVSGAIFFQFLAKIQYCMMVSENALQFVSCVMFYNLLKLEIIYLYQRTLHRSVLYPCHFTICGWLRIREISKTILTCFFWLLWRLIGTFFNNSNLELPQPDSRRCLRSKSWLKWPNWQCLAALKNIC